MKCRDEFPEPSVLFRQQGDFLNQTFANHPENRFRNLFDHAYKWSRSAPLLPITDVDSSGNQSAYKHVSRRYSIKLNKFLHSNKKLCFKKTFC